MAPRPPNAGLLSLGEGAGLALGRGSRRGSLAIVPGSHHLGAKGDIADYKSSRTQHGWRHEDDMPGMVKMTHKAGTIVVFDTTVWHTATANTSGVDRNSFFISFTPFWCRQTTKVAEMARILDAEGRATEPLRRQLLGLQDPATYAFVGPHYSKGVWGAFPQHDQATETMQPWVDQLLQSPACCQPRPTAADLAAASTFEAQGYIHIDAVFADAYDGGHDDSFSLSAARDAFLRCGASTAEVGGAGELNYIREHALRCALTHPRIHPPIQERRH